MNYVPEIVRKKLFKFVLHRAVGEYIDGGIDLDALDLDLDNGLAVVKRLRLNVKALNATLGESSPFHIADGYVGEIRASVPWRSWFQANCELEISGVRLIVEPNTTISTSTSKQKDKPSRVVSDSLMGDLDEEFELDASDHSIPQRHGSGSDSNSAAEDFTSSEVLAGLIGDILTKIKVRLIDVDIQFHNHSAWLGKRVAISVRLGEVSYMDVDEAQPNASAGDVRVAAAGTAVKELKFTDIDVFLKESTGRRVPLDLFLDDNDCMIIDDQEKPVPHVDGYSTLGVIIKANTQREAQVTLKVASNMPMPDSIDCTVQGFHVLLSPKNLHLLTEFVSGYLEHHTNHTAQLAAHHAAIERAKAVLAASSNPSILVPSSAQPLDESHQAHIAKIVQSYANKPFQSHHVDLNDSEYMPVSLQTQKGPVFHDLTDSAFAASIRGSLARSSLAGSRYGATSPTKAMTSPSSGSSPPAKVMTNIKLSLVCTTVSLLYDDFNVDQNYHLAQEYFAELVQSASAASGNKRHGNAFACFYEATVSKLPMDRLQLAVSRLTLSVSAAQTVAVSLSHLAVNEVLFSLDPTNEERMLCRLSSVARFEPQWVIPTADATDASLSSPAPSIAPPEQVGLGYARAMINDQRIANKLPHVHVKVTTLPTTSVVVDLVPVILSVDLSLLDRVALLLDRTRIPVPPPDIAFAPLVIPNPSQVIPANVGPASASVYTTPMTTPFAAPFSGSASVRFDGASSSRYDKSTTASASSSSVSIRVNAPFGRLFCKVPKVAILSPENLLDSQFLRIKRQTPPSVRDEALVFDFNDLCICYGGKPDKALKSEPAIAAMSSTAGSANNMTMAMSMSQVLGYLHKSHRTSAILKLCTSGMKEEAALLLKVRANPEQSLRGSTFEYVHSSSEDDDDSDVEYMDHERLHMNTDSASERRRMENSFMAEDDSLSAQFKTHPSPFGSLFSAKEGQDPGRSAANRSEGKQFRKCALATSRSIVEVIIPVAWVCCLKSELDCFYVAIDELMMWEPTPAVKPVTTSTAPAAPPKPVDLFQDIVNSGSEENSDSDGDDDHDDDDNRSDSGNDSDRDAGSKPPKYHDFSKSAMRSSLSSTLHHGSHHTKFHKSTKSRHHGHQHRNHHRSRLGASVTSKGFNLVETGNGVTDMTIMVTFGTACLVLTENEKSDHVSPPQAEVARIYQVDFNKLNICSVTRYLGGPGQLALMSAAKFTLSEATPEHPSMLPILTPCPGRVVDDMFSFAFGMKKDTLRRRKESNLAVDFRGVQLTHRMADAHESSWLFHLIDLIDLPSAVIPGYVASDALTKLYVNVTDLAIDYAPLHTGMQTLITCNSLRVMSTLVSGTPEFELNLFVTNLLLGLIDDRARLTYTSSESMNSPLTLRLLTESRGYAIVAQGDSVSLQFKKGSGIKSFQLGNNLLNFDLQPDSLRTLQAMIDYYVNSGDYKVVEVPVPVSSDTDKMGVNDDVMRTTHETFVTAGTRPSRSASEVSVYDDVKEAMDTDQFGNTNIRLIDSDGSDSDEDNNSSIDVEPLDGNASPGGFTRHRMQSSAYDTTPLQHALEESTIDARSEYPRNRRRRSSNPSDLHGGFVEEAFRSGENSEFAESTGYTVPAHETTAAAAGQLSDLMESVQDAMHNSVLDNADNFVAKEDFELLDLQDPRRAAGHTIPHESLKEDHVRNLLPIVDPPLWQETIIADYFAVPLRHDTRISAAPSLFPPTTFRFELAKFSLRIRLVDGSAFDHDAAAKPNRAKATMSGKGSAGSLQQNTPDYIEINLQDMTLRYEEFEPGHLEQDRILFVVKEIEVYDHVRASVYNLLLGYHRQPNKPRVSNSSMARIELVSVMPISATGNLPPSGSRSGEVERRLTVRVLPLDINLDQDTVEFLYQFVVPSVIVAPESDSAADEGVADAVAEALNDSVYDSTPFREDEFDGEASVSGAAASHSDRHRSASSDKSSPSPRVSVSPLTTQPHSRRQSVTEPPSAAETKSMTEGEDEDAMFFQSCVIEPVMLVIDYLPKRFNFVFDVPSVAKIANLAYWDSAELVFDRVTVNGSRGAGRLGERLKDNYIAQVMHQYPGVLAGLTPVRSLSNIVGGVMALATEPVRQYQQTGQIWRGIQGGAKIFVQRATVETFGLGMKVSSAGSNLVDRTMSMLSDRPGDAASAANEGDGRARVLSDTPDTFGDGLREAGHALYNGVAEPYNQYRKGEKGYLAGVVLRPMQGALTAISKALSGARNSIDPAIQKDLERKFKHRA